MTKILARRGRAAAAVLALAAAALGLSACLTPHVKPTPSSAVLEARRHRVIPAPAACPAIAAPVSVGFGFGEAQLSDLAVPAAVEAAHLMACHPQARAVIVGQADGHGTDAEQRALAQGRAEAVAQALRDRGVAAARLGIQAEGTAPASDAGRLVILAEGRRW